MKVAVLDIFFGDSGKGRVTHDLSPNFDWVIRFSGGNNCGHVIYRDGKKYTHNLLPSADYRSSHLKSFIASGVMVHPKSLYDEVMKNMIDFPEMPKSLYIDKDAFIVEDQHIEEDIGKNGHIGTTKKGIGPATVSKWSRSGKRIKDVLDTDKHLIELQSIGVNFIYNLSFKETFEKSRLLFEGAQGSLLDLNAGTYPFVTSSDCTVAGIYSSGFQYLRLDKVLGLTKAYATRVGEGPFPTEMFDKEAHDLREAGNEYGAVTKRPRRVGYLDLAACKYGAIKAGATHLVITKTDILNNMPEVKICTSYETAPVTGSDFFSTKPIYKTLKGWSTHTSKEHKDFLKEVSECVGLPIYMCTHGLEDCDITLFPS